MSFTNARHRRATFRTYTPRPLTVVLAALVLSNAAALLLAIVLVFRG